MNVPEEATLYGLLASIGLTALSMSRGGSRIFSQGGSGSQFHRDAAGAWGEGTEGGLGGIPQEKLEYEVL